MSFILGMGHSVAWLRSFLHRFPLGAPEKGAPTFPAGVRSVTAISHPCLRKEFLPALMLPFSIL